MRKISKIYLPQDRYISTEQAGVVSFPVFFLLGKSRLSELSSICFKIWSIFACPKLFCQCRLILYRTDTDTWCFSKFGSSLELTSGSIIYLPSIETSWGLLPVSDLRVLPRFIGLLLLLRLPELLVVVLPLIFEDNDATAVSGEPSEKSPPRLFNEPILSSFKSSGWKESFLLVRICWWRTQRNQFSCRRLFDFRGISCLQVFLNSISFQSFQIAYIPFWLIDVFPLFKRTDRVANKFLWPGRSVRLRPTI